jgi:cell division protein FtsZ
LFEVDEAATRIRSEVDPDANIIVGSALNEELAGKMRVSVVATGIEVQAQAQPKPSATVTQLPRPAQRRTAPAVAVSFGQTVAKIHPSEYHGTVAQAQTAAVHAVQAELPAIARTLEEPAPARAPVHQAMPPAVASLRASAARSERRDDPFIAPRPAVAPVKREALRAPDPFQEAAVVNGAAKTEDKPRRLGFFSRVAMAARLRPENTPPVAETKAPPPAQPAAVPAPSRPATLSGLEPEDRPQAARRDDDLLEIPAFLRRQSN